MAARRSEEKGLVCDTLKRVAAASQAET